MEQNLTREQYDKLRDCVVDIHGEKSARKFVRRGRGTVVVALLIQGEPITTYRSCFDVWVDSKQLDYSSRITNPKNPEPFKYVPLRDNEEDAMREPITPFGGYNEY